MATDSSSGRSGSVAGRGSEAKVYAANRIRLDPVKRLATVSTDTVLAPRSARYWRKASSSRM